MAKIAWTQKVDGRLERLEAELGLAMHHSHFERQLERQFIAASGEEMARHRVGTPDEDQPAEPEDEDLDGEWAMLDPYLPDEQAIAEQAIEELQGRVHRLAELSCALLESPDNTILRELILEELGDLYVEYGTPAPPVLEDG